jgi:hypothetical protein
VSPIKTESTKIGGSRFPCSFRKSSWQAEAWPVGALTTLYIIEESKVLEKKVSTLFSDSTRESTTSTMKKGDPGTNGSDLNKDNIIKPTLDCLSKEDHKALEAYHKEVDELFLSPYELTWQGFVQKDAASINISKSEVTSEIWPNPSLSLDDVQVRINSTLERQAKSSNELMRRLIEERDGKNCRS